MGLETLLGKTREYLPAEKEKVLEDAYAFAVQAHQGQLRESGEPFVEHPLQWL